MLNRIEWDKPKIKADVFSLGSLIAWLETMPGAGAYNFMDCQGRCLYGLYAASHGIAWLESGACGSYLSTEEGSRFCDLVYDEVAGPRPWTFGAALSRARALSQQNGG